MVIGQIKRSHRVITAVGHFILKMDTDELASEGERERERLTHCERVSSQCLVLSLFPTVVIERNSDNDLANE